jgi:hypothetical protein
MVKYCRGGGSGGSVDDDVIGSDGVDMIMVAS